MSVVNYCGKVIYPLRKDADAIILQMIGRGQPSRYGKQLNSYFCKSCGGFHVGNTAQPIESPRAEQE